VWKSLEGKRVHALRGRPSKGKFYGEEKSVPLEAILFDDGESYILFGEQDPYDYHDCCHSARTVEAARDPRKWAEMMSEWPEADRFDF
jgi:hypothetical protein